MSSQPNLGSPRDLRTLLEATAEALTLAYDSDDYENRIVARAGWALAAITGALKDDPADIGWDADFLRQKLIEEQAAAERAKAGERR